MRPSSRRSARWYVSIVPAVCVLAVVSIPAAALGRSGTGAPALSTQGVRSNDLERVHVGSLPSSSLPKLDPRLASAAGGGTYLDRSLGLYSADRVALPGGKVRVVVDAVRVPSVRAAIARLGGRVQASWRNLLQAVMPRSSLAALSRLEAVRSVRPPARFVADGAPGEEVATSLASAWHSKGVRGAGVKIAVIDGGFSGYTDRQAAGELPAKVTTMDFCDGGFSSETAHGTAVAEIVYDMAPDADLYLLCIGDEVQLGQAEQFAKSQGVQIINLSGGFPGSGRGDGTGAAGSVVSDARSSGILWVNAAGNQAMTHWSGTYNDPDGDQVHDWNANDDEGNTFIWPNESVICGVLKWDEWPAAKSDFALVLFLSSTGQDIAVLNDTQNGTQPPVEGGCIGQASGSDLKVAWAIIGVNVTTSPRLDLIADSPPLQYEVPDGSITDPATSPSALAAGALCWQSNALEPYSSEGPTIDGRVKPDIAGHDSVSSATYGAFSSCPSGFAGTSASSPEVAGAAALVKQFHPGFGPNELQAFLESNAIDLGAAGKDNLTGAGQLRLPDLRDTTAPVATALPATGRKGKLVKLTARISDDIGEMRLTGDTGVLAMREQIKQNGKVVIATLRTKVTAPQRAVRVTTAWRAPAKLSGNLQHCVRVTDGQGNTSPVSCAKLVVR
jgi:Subtilase family